jgi:hypothetical protein
MPELTESPELHKLTRHAGIAGQFSVSAVVEYEGEGQSTVTFVGSVYGGPVVMALPSGVQSFVTDPERFGSFDVDPFAWVRSFFGLSSHVNYPHFPGRLYDCEACESMCHCTPGEAECVYSGPYNGSAAE